MTGLELIVGVVLGGLVVGLHMQHRTMLVRHESRLRELGEADAKVLAHVERVDKELSAEFERVRANFAGPINERIVRVEIDTREHADTLARLCSKAGVRLGKDGG